MDQATTYSSSTGCATEGTAAVSAGDPGGAPDAGAPANATAPDERAAVPAYAAFISYRHLPRDTEVARTVQRAIESFRLPRGVTAAGASRASRRLGKCFRDEDELAASPSLPGSIRQALERSQSLVLICTPETQDSPWVRREIETFIALHGRERIICVLAAGDSDSSIPSILKTQLTPDAHGILREMPAEPLAADLRPEAKAKRKAELLRVIAAVAGRNFDDLRQRERARRHKRVVSVVATAMILISLVSTLATTAYQKSREAFIAESHSLAARSKEQFARGERIQAVESALAALPTSENDLNRPLISEAREALETALEINPDLSQLWRPLYVFDAKGEIVAVAPCIAGGWEAILDSTGTVTVLDLFTGRTLSSVDLHRFTSDPGALDPHEWNLAAAGTNKLILTGRSKHCSTVALAARSGLTLWSCGNTDVNTMTITDDGELCVFFSFTSEGSILVELVSAATGRAIDWMETKPFDTDGFRFALPCAYEPDRKIAHLGIGSFVLSFFFEDQACRMVDFDTQCVFSLMAREDKVYASSSIMGPEEPRYVDMTFKFNAASVTKDPAQVLWNTEGHFEYTSAGPAFGSRAYAGDPRIHQLTIQKEQAIVCSAGRRFKILSCEDGREIYSEDFNNSIVGTGLGYGGDESDFIAFALADGSLDVRMPLEPYTSHGDSSRTIIPYQIDQAFLEQHDDGNIYALLHAANSPERLLCYRYDIADLSNAPVSLSLDELIAQAHELLDGR